MKPPEVLTRDRLLGMYEVKPVLSKLRSTLVGSGAALLVCAVLLFGLIRAGADEDGMYGGSCRSTYRAWVAGRALALHRVNMRMGHVAVATAGGLRSCTVCSVCSMQQSTASPAHLLPHPPSRLPPQADLPHTHRGASQVMGCPCSAGT